MRSAIQESLADDHNLNYLAGVNKSEKARFDKIELLEDKGEDA